ncbi:MAG TPA: DUF1707 domain-containing protein [Gemmatimonadaceae bacterium]|nr:DUF1707 domain-containing protein [Gemmatimonadaceae bacterium]
MRHDDWRPRGDEHDDEIRAADADREATAERLRKHHLEGRLTDDELDQRLERCMAARTLGELRALVADLPGERPREARGSAWRRRALFPFFPLLPALIALALLLGAFAHAVAWHHAAWHHAAWHHGGPPYGWGFPWLLFLLIAGALFLWRRARCEEAWHARGGAER